MIAYLRPSDWICYDRLAVIDELVHAKAAMLALVGMPSQRSWAERLQTVQLKREVAGTSRIEGADFDEQELDAAMRRTPEQLATRSQRQAAAAAATYRWIATLPDDQPLSPEVVREIHRRLITGADDDHCPPGRLRGRDENVTFGIPRHRGVAGGEECESAFAGLLRAARTEFAAHDPLIQALALHYHFAAMHPFLDGNGRTARALEALLLQRCGLRDSLFIAMSNYYYEEKNAYLSKLAEVRSAGHDLTTFLQFGLRGIALQCERLFAEIRVHVQKALFRNVMLDLFGRLESPKKRVMARRQVEILKLFLERDSMAMTDLISETKGFYSGLKNSDKAFIRDVIHLRELGAIRLQPAAPVQPGAERLWVVNLAWPTEITETSFFERVKKLAKSRTTGLYSSLS